MKSQRGYGLAEMMAALTITGILAVLIVVVMPQITSVPEKGESQVDALHALQNTIHWVSLDAGSAKAADGGGSLTLTMPDDTTISYTRAGDTLYRHCGESDIAVAANIRELVFTVEGRLITIALTAAPESRWGLSESRTYQIAMRPSGT